jgi:hypothetical protein
MTIPPQLLETAGLVVVTVVGSAAARLVSSVVNGWLSAHGRTVELKLRSGRQVRLDLDERLAPEKVNELIGRVLASDEAGDEVALRATVEASHAASQTARAAHG